MNNNLWAIGRCGYCGIKFEEFDKDHTAKCKKRHEDYLKSKDIVHQLKRIADKLTQK